MLDKIKKQKKIVVAVVIILLAIVAMCIIALSLGNKSYNVTFYSDSDYVLKVQEVKRNGTALPPNEPQLTYGKIFQSWDNDFSRVKKDLDIHPIFENILDKKNAFVIPGAYGTVNEEMILPIQLTGDVCTSGFDIIITYDSAVLELIDVVNADECALVNNEKVGNVRINYISAKNTVGDVDVCQLKFVIREKCKSTPVKISVNSIYAFEDSDDLKNDKLYKPEYNIINSNVFVMP